MKFVLLTQYYPPEIGGAQVLMGSLAMELKRQGHDIRVITALPNYPTGRIFDGYHGKFFVREVRDGVPVFRSWVYPAQSASLIPRLINYLTFCFTSLFAIFWMGKPDIIFVDSPPIFLALTALFLARWKGARWVMNISDLWPDAIAESGLVNSGFLLEMAKKLERFLYKRADFVGAVTEGIQEVLLQKKGVPQRKILFLPIGVDTQLFQPRIADQTLLGQYGLTDKSVFIYAGTLGHAQGLPLLLDAAEELRNRKDIFIVFIGDGPVKPHLRVQKDQRRLSNVLFIEPVPLTEMPRWWSIARAALVPLKDHAVHQGARPSKALPALASGIPVIFSGRGEMARILSDAQAGIVIPPEQTKPIVESILRLAEDEVLARKLGENGKQLCQREFSWQKIVQRWLEDIALKSSLPL